MKNLPAYRLMLAVTTLASLASACNSGSPYASGSAPASSAAQPAAAANSNRNSLGFWVRPGYKVDRVASELGNARFMEFGPGGVLYLSRPGNGDILTLKASGGKYSVIETFVSGYRTVHGLCFADGWLWFTQSGAVHKARDTDGDGKADETTTVLKDGQLPKGGGHWWRSIVVGKTHFWTSIGDAGNINDETATERQKVFRFKLDGTEKALWSGGIRNTEKLRFRPGTQEVWGVDHGSDWYGRPFGDTDGNQPMTDTMPPCEFNRYDEGGFYGHPFLVGNRVPRLEWKDKVDLAAWASKTTIPMWNFGAHTAPNGFTFLSKPIWPDHKGDAFVAFHGSWNSSKRVGYGVDRVLFDTVTGLPYGSLNIVSTLGENGRVLSRPVDCVEAPDGSVLFSCDSTGSIYRITKK